MVQFNACYYVIYSDRSDYLVHDPDRHGLNALYLRNGEFSSLTTIAGALYNGSYINKQYVKEVMKRHPQVDKHILIEQYRNKNEGQLPQIKDIFVSFYEPSSRIV